MYKYGFEIPRDYEHTVRLDDTIYNYDWRDYTLLESKQLDSYSAFIESSTYDTLPTG